MNDIWQLAIAVHARCTETVPRAHALAEIRPFLSEIAAVEILPVPHPTVETKEYLDEQQKERPMIVEARINDLLIAMAEGWRRGSGTLFAQSFSKDAHFVAFDGSVHHGPDEIAAYHQKAFDNVLQGTSLDLTVTDIRQVDQKIWLVFAKGWHRPHHLHNDQARAESVNIFVCRIGEANAEVLAFQNTRVRPITDQNSAAVWKAFDTSWENRKTANA